MKSSLTPEQLTLIMSVEKACSVISLLGVTFIMLTFNLVPAFYKPINRVIFWASLGNVFTNIATLMGRSAVEMFGLCQIQAFLIQMFMPADAFWTLAMACNVWLTLNRRFDQERLRKLDGIYFTLCYGLPFVPALTFLFINSRYKGHMYGDATIWCWIADEWKLWRILAFYGPVWISQGIVLLIYLQAGTMILDKRRALHRISRVPESPINAAFPDKFVGRRTTITVDTTTITTETSTDATSSGALDSPITNVSAQRRICLDGRDSPRLLRKANKVAPSYRWSISTIPNVDLEGEGNNLMCSEKRESVQSGTVSTAGSVLPCTHYLHTPRGNSNELDHASWSYAKCCFLFFCAMMVTWIPSSANRLYGIVSHGHVSASLEIASAFVLPLQGFWNAVIYSYCARPAVKMLCCQIKRKILRQPEPAMHQHRASQVSLQSHHQSSQPSSHGTLRDILPNRPMSPSEI